MRETLEETGWHVELTAVVGIHQWTLPGTDHMYLRICFAGQALRHDSTRALDHGIQRALWLSRDELGQMSGRLRSPLVLACVDGYLSGQRYPLHLIVDHDRKITGHPPA
ncbi:MAG: hypothetical protein HY940_08990 [Gammaproteobacteria bacterium]|nr:hypothetical protein [Gammaproteobacteria bacterium]